MKKLKVTINQQEMVAKEITIIEDKKTTHNIMITLETGFKFFDSEKVKEIIVNGVQYEKTAFLTEDGFDYTLCYWNLEGIKAESLPTKRSFELPLDHEWYTSQGMWTITYQGESFDDCIEPLDKVWFPKLLKVGERTYKKRFQTKQEAEALSAEYNERIAQRKQQIEKLRNKRNHKPTKYPNKGE